MGSEPLIPPFDFYSVVIRPWTTDLEMTLWIVSMGALVGIACGVLGCFLVLQRKALLGDAISHALLAGLVGAFLLTGSRGPLAMIVGAIIAGLLTVVAIEAIHRHSRVKEDASIAVVFSTLFALGIILITRFTEGIDLDAQCVLYGEIEGSWLRTGSVEMMAVVAIVVLAGVVVAFKELKIASFDPATATAIGINAGLVHYALMTAVSVTVVCGMEAVGAILVVTMLIAPGATAYLLTDNLRRMLLIAAACGASSALFGHHVALWLDCSTAGAISLVATGQFAVTLLASPRHGVVMRAVRKSRLALRIARENVLRAVYQLSPSPALASNVTLHALGERLRVLPVHLRRTCQRLRRQGCLDVDAHRQVALTERGAVVAKRIVRAHRLWETFLVDQMGVASDHVHPDAEEIEHILSERLLDRLDDQLGHPAEDPHGQTIPQALDWIDAGRHTTISQLRDGDVARVAGIAPGTSPMAAERIAAMSLPLGVDVRLGARSPDGAWTVRLPDGSTREIDHELADAIQVEHRRPTADD